MKNDIKHMLILVKQLDIGTNLFWNNWSVKSLNLVESFTSIEDIEFPPQFFWTE